MEKNELYLISLGDYCWHVCENATLFKLIHRLNSMAKELPLTKETAKIKNYVNYIEKRTAEIFTEHGLSVRKILRDDASFLKDSFEKELSAVEEWCPDDCFECCCSCCKCDCLDSEDNREEANEDTTADTDGDKEQALDEEPSEEELLVMAKAIGEVLEVIFNIVGKRMGE